MLVENMVNKFERYLSSEFIEKQIIPLSSDSCKHTCNLDSENTFSLYTMTAVIIVNKIRSCEKRVTKKKCLIRKKKGRVMAYTKDYSNGGRVWATTEQHKGTSICLGGTKDMLINKGHRIQNSRMGEVEIVPF